MLATCYVGKHEIKYKRAGRELDPRYFDKAEREAFELADEKEWTSGWRQVPSRSFLLIKPKRYRRTESLLVR